jgi:hypothetical protein
VAPHSEQDIAMICCLMLHLSEQISKGYSKMSEFWRGSGFSERIFRSPEVITSFTCLIYSIAHQANETCCCLHVERRDNEETYSNCDRTFPVSYDHPPPRFRVTEPLTEIQMVPFLENDSLEQFVGSNSPSVIFFGSSRSDFEFAALSIYRFRSSSSSAFRIRRPALHSI